MISSKYYSISSDWELEVKGVEHQLSVLNPYYNFQMDYSYWKIPLRGEIPNNVYFPVFKLHQDAKLPDVLEVDIGSSNFRVFSKKLLQIIKGLNVQEYSTRQIVITSEKKLIENYHAFHFNDIIEDKVINWQESLFSICNKIDWANRSSGKVKKELEEVQFDNLEDYRKKREELKKQGNKLTLSKKELSISSDYDYDLALHVGLLGGIVCSEKFKNKVEKNNIVGLKFTPLKLKFSAFSDEAKGNAL